MRIAEFLQKFIRPSATESLQKLWIKSLFNSALFLLIFMIFLPMAAGWVFPVIVAVPGMPTYLPASGCLLFGFALWIACIRAFGEQGKGTPFPLDAPRELVTSGPFAIVRNPIMIAEIFVIWGEAFLISRIGVYIYAVAIMVIAHFVVRRIEEPELRKRFGSRYAEYCRSVPRWIPRISQLIRR